MMLVNKKFKANEVITTGKNATNFALIRGQVGLRAKFYDEHQRVVLDTELNQGMVLNGLRYSKIEFTSDVDQDLQFWSAHVPYSSTTEALQPRNIAAKTKRLVPFVQELLPEDKSRRRALVSCPVDWFVGGEDMGYEFGSVVNGRKVPANSELEISAWGRIKYWVTNDDTKTLGEPGQLIYVDPAWTTRSQLQAAGLQYIDVDIPEELDGEPLEILSDVTIAATGLDIIDFTPSIWVTDGDPTTENVTRVPLFDGSGRFSNDKQYLGNTRTVTLTAGLHRIFFGEYALDSDAVANAGHAYGGLSFSSINRLYTRNLSFLETTYAEVFTERA